MNADGKDGHAKSAAFSHPWPSVPIRGHILLLRLQHITRAKTGGNQDF
jgi:hypothetical protein